MSDQLHPLAPHHLPFYLAPGSGVDTLMLVMGLYPRPFLTRMEKSVEATLARGTMLQQVQHERWLLQAARQGRPYKPVTETLTQ